MSNTKQPTNDAQSVRPGGNFSLAKLAASLVAACLLGGLAAWFADMGQDDWSFAPHLIFPLLTGIGLGMAIIGAVRVGQVGHRPTILLSTLLAALIVVGGEFYPTRHREAATPPEWAVDGLLTVLAALVIVYPITRLPFCNQCGTWLRTIRSGRIDGGATLALAELAGTTPETPPKSGRYRLSSCMGGCSDSDLVLLWEDTAGATFTYEASIDSEARNRLMQIADAACGAADLEAEDSED